MFILPILQSPARIALTEIFVASHINLSTRDSASMLEAIRQAQAHFIVDTTARQSFGDLLDILLSITESEYGFIGEIFNTDDGEPYLKTHSITNVAWNEATRSLYDKYTAEQGMEFRNLKTLFGQVMVTGKPVIANDPTNDPRSGGLPPGHPPMSAFMGLPFFFNGKMVGMIGVANNPSGYVSELVDWLTPFLNTCATLIVGYRNTRDRALAEKSLQLSNSNFHALLHAVPDLMFELDGSGIYLNVWGVRGDLLLAPKSQLIGQSINEVLPAEAAQQVLAAIQEADQNGTSFGYQILLTLNTGQHWFELSVSRKYDSSDQSNSYIVLSRDITAQKNIEYALKQSEEKFRLMFENNLQGIVIQNEKGEIVSANNMAQEILGLTLSQMQGSTSIDPMWRTIHEDGSDFPGDTHPAMVSLQTGKAVNNVVMGVFNPGKNQTRWISVSAVPLINPEESTPYLVFATFSDITERRQSEEEIQQLAFYDALTKLPNRRLLIDRLQQALASTARSGREGALLFIDLDNFKTLNDTLGHNIGDLLLQQVAQRLKSCVREGDTLSRLGGDEFVVILEVLSEDALKAVAQTEIVCDKILEFLSQPYRLITHEYHLSASIGATLFKGHQTSIEELMKQADIAMYQAKKSGRNTLCFFDVKMQSSVNVHATLQRDLHSALENDQFRLYYQIQVDSSNRPLGAEALIRWEHPERGLVSPAHFIPLAEESSLILPIGKWVLETACIQLKAWQQNPLTRNLVLAVNISARQFRQVDFVSQVSVLLQRYGIDPMLIKLELTESLLLEDIEKSIATMNALNDVGVQFSLDDFGTGYSSLQYLKRLPFDQLKIDQSFVRDIVVDSSDKAIVRTIIAIAQSLDLDVISEGVETNEQRQLLQDNGCHHYQGYLFGKPLPIEQFDVLLKQD